MGAIENLAIPEMVVLMILTALLLLYYRSPELTPFWLASVVGASWLLGFSGIILLPLDIAAAASTESKAEWMTTCWSLVYWVTFVLAWVALPVLYESWYAGEQTLRARLSAGVKANLKSYCAMLVGGIIFGVYLLVMEKMTLSSLSDFLLVFGNTYGLLIILVLLGNGLVDVPRRIWRLRSSAPEEHLHRLQLRALAVEEALTDSTYEMEDVEKAVFRMQRRLEAEGPSLPNVDSLRKHMEQIVRACGHQSNDLEDAMSPLAGGGHAAEGARRNSHGHRAHDRPPSTDSDEPPSSASLSQLMKRVRVSKETLHAATQRWKALQAAWLKAKAGSSGGGAKEVHTSKLSKLWSQSSLSRPLLGALSFVCAGLSGLVLWSEIALALPFYASPIGLVISALSNGAHPVAVQLIALVPYAYMSLCVFSTLFRLKFFSILALHGPRQSSAGPLLFNAIYLCRLQFPLGYNFLLILSPPSAQGNAAFSADVAFNSLMTSMDTVPLFGQGFVVYAPVILVVLCALTLFNIYEKFLGMLGLESEDADVADEDRAVLLREGGMLLEQASRRERSGCAQRQRRGAGSSSSSSSSAAPEPCSLDVPTVETSAMSPFFGGIELADIQSQGN